MKLKDVKERIDNFFDNISAEKLYEVSVLKYGFFIPQVPLDAVPGSWSRRCLRQR